MNVSKLFGNGGQAAVLYAPYFLFLRFNSLRIRVLLEVSRFEVFAKWKKHFLRFASSGFLQGEVSAATNGGQLLQVAL